MLEGRRGAALDTGSLALLEAEEQPCLPGTRRRQMPCIPANGADDARKPGQRSKGHTLRCEEP